MTMPANATASPRAVGYRGQGAAVDTPATDARVLLLVESGGNRDILINCLGERHHVVEPEQDGGLPEDYDLCVVDTPSFVKWRLHLADTKEREQPIFLPVLLILQKRQLAQRLEQQWDAVDEFVVAPIDKREFVNRVGLLLRARRLALTQQDYLGYVVNHDRPTGLPNKNLFLDRVTTALRDAAVTNATLHVAILRVHLDTVLKSLGNVGVKQAAVQISRRLEAWDDAITTVARLEAEDWALLFRGGIEVSSVVDALGKVAENLRQPVQVQGERVFAKVSIGVARYPDDATDAVGLLDGASAARGSAPNDQPAFYSRTVQYHALRHLRTEARLRDAIAEGAFELHFQPRIDLRSGAVTSAEALVRWRLPDGQMVSPGEFIPVAEATGLISDIDRWVLVQSCASLARWRAAGIGPPKLSVNITPADIEREDFHEALLASLDRNGLPYDALELELTETTLFEMSLQNLTKLRELRDLGIPLAMDDFGTGYSSLSYLHKLPISVLKIDRAFIDGLPEDPNNDAIARTVVHLGRNFDLTVVAEGIETAAQARHLGEMGCGFAQGFFFAKPLPEPAFTDLVAAPPWQPWAPESVSDASTG